MPEKVILTRYPKCVQHCEFELPEGLKTDMDRYNYIEHHLQHIVWNPPEIIESEEELYRHGYYFKRTENG